MITGLQAALDGKVDDSQVLTNVPANAVFTDTNTVYTHPANHAISVITGLQAALDGKVDDSQVLTNVPAGAVFTDTVYTLPAGYATETYVGTAISNLVDSSPATLDTLNELAAALGDDPNFATTVSNSIATKLPLAGGTLTGTLNIVTGDASESIINLLGGNQGTGKLYVGQSTIYGGGIEYNGDGTPTSSGSGADYITLYRRTSGADSWTARNFHNSNDWKFRGNLYANETQRVFADDYHPNADTWTTARTLGVTLTGDVTGSATMSVNGGSNQTATITTVVANDSHSHSNYLPLTGGTVSGTLTLDNGGNSSTSLVMKGTAPTISFLDDDTNADDFYIHVNSNKFYILANRTDAEVDLVGAGWETPHPMYLDSAANTGYLFDQRMFSDSYHPNADTWTTARTLGVTLTGDVTGSATMSVNGGSNQTATITTVVANDSHTHSNYVLKAGGTLTGTLTSQALTRTNTRISSTHNYPIGHYSSGDTVFEIDPTWSEAELASFFNGNVSWTADSTAPAGYAITITGNVSVGGAYGSGFPFIPVGTSDVFYMECYIKNVGTSQTHYMGSNEYNESFGSLGGNPGSYGYWVMINTDVGNSWTKVSAYITGFGNSIGQFKTGVKYWTPMALFNYGAGTGTRACVISGWKAIKVNASGNRTFEGTISSGAITSTGLTISGQQKSNIVAVAALDVDCSLGNYFTKTISGNSTFTFSNVPATSSYSFILELTHTSGTITWPASVQWPNSSTPALTTGKTHLFVFITDDAGARWRGSSSINYVS